MPIKIQSDLPAKQQLESENIFVMDESRALSQEIRPLKILIVNLMPLKEATELDLLRSLSNTPLQLNVSFLKMKSHTSKHTKASHLEKFYISFDEIKNKHYDGMIITGAPIEKLDFEEVTYWDEITTVMDWSKDHVTSTLHICWAAQAGMYYHYGVRKNMRKEKLSGVYLHHVIHRTGLYLVVAEDGKNVFVMGHPEYDRFALDGEYRRDLYSRLKPSIPVHYYPDNNPAKRPRMQWRSHANALYTNWINYYVYQVTPYILDE